MAQQAVVLPLYGKMPMNIWGKSTLLLNLLYRQGMLPVCHIAFHEEAAGGDYRINGIRVGNTEEEVTTNIWRMVEVYADEGHIEFDNRGEHGNQNIG